MSVKDRILILVIIAAFAGGVFGYPYLIDWLHTDEPVHTAKVLVVVGLIVLVIGLYGFNNDLIYKVKKDQERIQEVADRIEAYQKEKEITMKEMRANAESLLNDDEKAMMQMMKLHPEYRRTGEFTPKMFGAKIDTKV